MLARFARIGALIVNSAPNGWVTYVTERRKVDIRDEPCACTSQNYDLVSPVLRNPIEGLPKFC